jgi:hypothetical protein
MKLRCSQTCNKIATAFGQFCGGICDTHALEGLQSGDYKLETFWEEHRERLTNLLKEALPFKPGDWVVDSIERVARVKSVSRFSDGEVMLDLYMYSDRGDNIGRTSPAMGGPRTYEPCCSALHWTRLEGEPDWPLRVTGVPTGDGKVTLQKWAGERNPKPANYIPRKRRGGSFRVPADDSKLRQALLDIAGGHNDARRRAKDALGLL